MIKRIIICIIVMVFIGSVALGDVVSFPFGSSHGMSFTNPSPDILTIIMHVIISMIFITISLYLIQNIMNIKDNPQRKKYFIIVFVISVVLFFAYIIPRCIDVIERYVRYGF